MKKSHLKKIIRSTLCEIVKEESDSEKLLNMKIKNPETGDDIKLKSALAYDKSSQVYKVAKSTHDKAMQIIKKDSEKGNQDAPSSEPTKEPSSEPTKEPSSKPEKEKEKEDWEKSDEERIKDRETAKEKINQIPKETLKKFQDADREYEKAYDKAGASTGPTHAGDVYGSMAAYNFDKVKPKLADYAPKGYEDEYGEYRDLKNKASFRSDAEKEADKEKSLKSDDWNDTKQDVFGKLQTYDNKDYGEMFKKSHADIDNGNITKETLPNSVPTWFDASDSGSAQEAAEREYDLVINKAYNKNSDATKDALIKRAVDKEEEMANPDNDKVAQLKSQLTHTSRIKNPEGARQAKQDLERMTSVMKTDLKFLQDKMGEKELASSIEKEKQERKKEKERIEKEKAYNKKSAVGKMLSKIGIGETMKKSELQAIIREEIQNVINESFSNWQVKFTRAIKNKLAGDVKKGHVEVVKARGTSEAIKKACKNAGCEGAWMHVDVEVTKK